ncbi:MAG TPA: sulfurtransferase [Vicinamibacterales bacterium]|jgi:thiosulfate/3-mercaptopyruvate sulfurtransferase|nr:sulfurtransferase [Vicinamibacterales bacterium]
MTYTTLIATSALAEHLDNPDVVVVDCRFALEDPSWGEREYAARHIRGAVYAHLDRDLSGPKNGRNGRHPLPSPDVLVHTFSGWGIDARTQVVAYGAQTDMFPARVWWLLRWMGHDAVAVLDGGIDRWISEGRAVSSGHERRVARVFTGTPRKDMLVDAQAVAQLAGNKDWRVLDARAPERFRGDVEPIDQAAGHIPGARNVPFKNNLDAGGSMRPATELASALAPALGSTPPSRVVCYCGSGVSACHDLLAMEHAGLHGAKLYAGSWSEWSSDPSRPVEKGAEK